MLSSTWACKVACNLLFHLFYFRSLTDVILSLFYDFAQKCRYFKKSLNCKVFTTFVMSWCYPPWRKNLLNFTSFISIAAPAHNVIILTQRFILCSCCLRLWALCTTFWINIFPHIPCIVMWIFEHYPFCQWALDLYIPILSLSVYFCLCIMIIIFFVQSFFLFLKT